MSGLIAIYRSTIVTPWQSFPQNGRALGSYRTAQLPPIAPPTHRVVGALTRFLHRFGLAGIGGTGTITGTVKIGTIPVARQVRLYDALSGVLLATTWSDAAGNYRFEQIIKGPEYTVSSVDHARGYNDVIGARVTGD
jgi:hypothetical protein